MAEYTVFDIKGKGFKYEQYAQEQENAPPPTGTFGCFIGTSNWGPINKPYTIKGGILEFKETFGYGGTKVDHGWDATNLHFKANSALGVFTRIADENIASRSSLVLKDKADKPAIVTGSIDIRNGILISNDKKNMSLKVQYQEEGGVINELDPLEIDFSNCLSNEAEVNGILSIPPVTIGTTQEITIQINNSNGIGTIRTFLIKPTSTTVINSISDFATLIQNDSFTTVRDENENIIINNKPSLSTYLTITLSGNSINLKAKNLNSSFKVSDPLKIIAKSSLNVPLKTPYVSILMTINNAFNFAIDGKNGVSGVANYSFASINQNGNLILTGINNGNTSKIYINNGTINEILGLVNGSQTAGDQTGEKGTAIGTFRAAYRGVEGNTIKLRFYEDNGLPNLGIFFRNNLVSNIVDYNFNVNSEFFLGNLIANDEAANKIIRYDHALKFYDFTDEDDMMSEGVNLKTNDGTDIGSNWKIQEGFYSLSGGDSGENSNDLNYIILNAIEELKNIDLYQIDFIAAPGYEEENVQNALLALCVYRQDCFAFIDMPLITGTTKRDAVNKAVRYINGSYLRTEKIDSIYGVLAFPYVRFRKRFYNSQNLLVSEISLVSPTVILPYLYSLKDINTGTSFDIAAGESYGGRILLSANDFTGTQFILNQEDRELLYADSLDACINPISFNNEAGFFLDGQKTALRKNLNGKLTSLSRISVMRSGLFIKKISYRISRQYFFAPIDPITWRDFASRLTREIMQPLASARMIEPNFIVKCDEITNTPSVRNANGMVAYIEFTPYKKLERIKVIANITETDASLTLT